MTGIVIPGMVDGNMTCILLAYVPGVDITVIVHMRDIARRKQEDCEVEA